MLVYDLGGGTFDASVLELADRVYEVISTGGDTFLGGVDFDARIVAPLLRGVREGRRPFQGDAVALSRLADAAERAKCALSEQASFPSSSLTWRIHEGVARRPRRHAHPRGARAAGGAAGGAHHPDLPRRARGQGARRPGTSTR